MTYKTSPYIIWCSTYLNNNKTNIILVLSSRQANWILTCGKKVNVKIGGVFFLIEYVSVQAQETKS